MRLYHYTSLDNFLSIWQSKELWFSSSKTTNDYFERNRSVTINANSFRVNGEKINVSASAVIDKIFKEIESYKQISLCRDYGRDFRGSDSPMMWGQYARTKNRNGVWEDGVCIELDSRKIKFPSQPLYKGIVKYTSKIEIPTISGLDFSAEDSVSKFVNENIDSFFFVKHRHWIYEKEYRYVSQSAKALDISKAINGIYVLGMNSDTANKVESVVSDDSLIYCLCVGGIKYKRMAATNLREYREMQAMIDEINSNGGLRE